jgi:hypothetical protein
MSRRLVSLLATVTLAVGALLMAAGPARAEHGGHGGFSGYGRGFYGYGYGRGFYGYGYGRGFYGGFFPGFYGYGY